MKVYTKIAATMCDLPFEQRMAIRAALELQGCECVSYTGRGLHVLVPRGVNPWRLDGVTIPDEPYAVHYFPLGSERLPEHFRHDGNYPGSRGFKMLAYVIPNDLV